MAKYKVVVDGEGIETVDARTEKEAKLKAFRKLGIKSMLKVKTLTPKTTITKEAAEPSTLSGPLNRAQQKIRNDRLKMVAKKTTDAKEKQASNDKKKGMKFKEHVEVMEDATAGLKKKAEKSGMPLSVLRSVYNRGVAAWKTGHRPGTTPQQWGFARVNSFVTKSSGTWGKADKDLAAKVRGS
tara:strand:+ start:477 stop:1025 length:549 start_codon:yes stop_codon:yes gene_type:complete